MKNLLAIILLVFSFNLFAQKSKEFDAKFENAVKVYESKNYNKAIILFSDLLVKHKNNDHLEEASYFTALSYYNNSDTLKAKQLMAQMTNNFQDWDRIEEVYYVLGAIAFEENKNFDAVSYLQHCKSNKIKLDAINLEKSFLHKVKNIETLKYLHKRFPDDETLALVLAHKFAEKKFLFADDKMLLQYLMQTFVFDKELQSRLNDLENKGMKDSYNVSVVFPFQYDELRKFKAFNKNQFVIDLYNGIKLGFDELNINDKIFKLNLYDTKHDTTELKKLLRKKELTYSDLIIGPIYPEENEFISPFCLKYGITKINPLSSSSIKGDSIISLYYKTSIFQQGKVAANFCYDSITKKSVFIAGYQDNKDSIYINSFKSEFERLGGKDIKIVYFGKTDQILNKMQSYKLDTTNTKVIIGYNPKFKLVSGLSSYYTVERSEIPFFTTNAHIHSKHFLPEAFKYSKLYATHDELISKDSLDAFTKRYLDEFSRPPSMNSLKGYELAKFFGSQMKEKGKYFITSLQEEDKTYSNNLFSDFNYYESSCNTKIPVVRMVDYQLINTNYSK